MVKISFPTQQQVWDWLDEIPDPEIPVISVVELGVVRAVELSEGRVRVDITPTYSGCPALKMMEADIVTKLKEKGISEIEIRMVYAPAWTTDWLGKETLEKLKRYGIAPPGKIGRNPSHQLHDGLACPFCSATNTRLQSAFGSTACKALYYCDHCQQPFEHFKCI
jgi:ring-1,2-phenylacetyl-CoA epoxidase subunit PaaD